MSAVPQYQPLKRIDAPRRRPPGSRGVHRRPGGPFAWALRRRRIRPLIRRDGYGGMTEAAAVLEQKAELHVVPRRRVAANAAAIVVVLLGVLMLSAVVLHTRLAERQLEIDRVEQEVANQRALFDILRQQRAELRSPTRLAAESNRLGMYSPPGSKFLAADPWTRARILAATGAVDAFDGLLVQGDSLDQVMRVRAANEAGR